MFVLPEMMVTASVETMMHRVMSAPIISRRRSMRSDIAPVKSENKSQGSLVAMVMPEMSTGSRVNSAASKGNAVRNMPTPVQDDVTENMSNRKSRPSERLLLNLATHFRRLYLYLDYL